MLCLTLSGRTIEDNLKQLDDAVAFVSIARLCCDCLDRDQLGRVGDMVAGTKYPLILSCRRLSDGGRWTGTERERADLLCSLVVQGFKYIEIDSSLKRPRLEELCKVHNVRIIRTFRDGEGVPPDLFIKTARLAARGDIPQLIVNPRGIGDLCTVFRIRQELASVPEKIIVTEGPFGIPGRILYRLTGSMIGYCSYDPSIPDGVLDPQILSRLYRADSVGPETAVYGVIGNPVYHSVSPGIHNPGFRALGMDAVYVPFLTDSVRAFFKLAEQLDIRGFSVTTPFKKEVLPYLGKGARDIKLIGSCNTLIRVPNLWKGINTDYHGFLTMCGQFIVPGSNAIVIGAGGAAASVVWALKSSGCKVVILNRNPDHARRLGEYAMCQWDSLENAGKYSGTASFIVQATNVGMAPHEGTDPVPSLEFTGKEMVCELVYNPVHTAFLSRAEKAGCQVFYGIDLILTQARLQFAAFAGQSYPEGARPMLQASVRVG